MQPIVLQLQGDCLEPQVSILDVLRKALVVAKKLGVPEFEAWVEKELQGYTKDDRIPDYRVLNGQLRAWNPVLQRWIQVVVTNHKLQEELCRTPIGQAVGEIEHTVQHLESDGILEVPLPAQTEQELMRAGRLPLRATRHISGASAKGIVDRVRTIVLDWCLKLEERGIIGEGMTFSAKEKETASQINYNLNVYGPVSSTQIQQGTMRSSQSISNDLDFQALREFLAEVAENVDQLGLQSELKQQLTAELRSIEAQVSAPQPKRIVIVECLKSIRNILEGCVGSLAATGLLKTLAFFLPH